MALSDEDDARCWQINKNLNDYHIEREKKRLERSGLQVRVAADREKLSRLQSEEVLIAGQIAVSIPTQAVPPLAAAAAFLQLSLGARDLTQVWADIEDTQYAIETLERDLDALEWQIAELTRLMTQSWEEFERTPCEVRHRPVGVPRY